MPKAYWQDGTHVHFHVKIRARNRPPAVGGTPAQGHKTARSNGQVTRQRSTPRGGSTVAGAFATPAKSVRWQAAIAAMIQAQQAQHLRPDSIDQYRFVLIALRKTFPRTAGPAEITPEMARQFKVLRPRKSPLARSKAISIACPPFLPSGLARYANWLTVIRLRRSAGRKSKSPSVASSRTKSISVGSIGSRNAGARGDSRSCSSRPKRPSAVASAN